MPFDPIKLEPINANPERLARIFSDEFAFAVPTYQRPYAWERDQAGALLDDVLAAVQEARAEKEPVTYFLGSIVLIKQSGSPDAMVVDGQQRLTTLTILLSVLRDLSADQSRWKRHKYICEEGDPDKGTKDRWRLTARKRDTEFLQSTVQKLGATDNLPPTAGLSDSRLRIVENTALLRTRLQKLTEIERDDLIAFLLQRCYLVVVSVANVETAHRVFTVLNARGLDLTPTDMLKADLLDRVPPETEADYANLWEAQEERLGRDGFVNLFQHIRMIYQREKPRTRLEIGFREHVKDFAKPEEFVSKVLEPFGTAYAELLSRSAFAARYGTQAGRHLGFLRLLDNNDWEPPAVQFLARGPHTAVATFFRELERLAFFLFVTRSDINGRIARYAKVLEDLLGIPREGAPFRAIDLTSDEKAAFTRGLDGPLYLMVRVRLPVLLRLDAALTAGGVEYDHSVITVEHVLPQNPSAESEWLARFPDPTMRDEWTHRIGNLVLLTRAKNAQAANLAYPVETDTH